ncbi:tripartite tricarboxylate transporter substrate binding protein [Roseomonas sp. CAU 1739]|uniref:Bug family tripartite tricarboxylate transporter substrate binding protein n=1 Tax=Roseomonas sp. CAU 1739 TaxID=3140364 RepID=UPI00325A641C
MTECPRLSRRGLLVGLGSAALPAAARAQGAYPTRPVEVVLSWAPGGSSDSVARLLAQALATEFGHPFVVNNRPGAGGTIGHAYVARARPDGYTLLVATNSTYAIAPYLYENIPYDGDTAFAPISLLGTNAQVLTVHPSVPATTTQDFIAWAKAQRDPVPYASSGIGATSHLSAELFMSMADVTMLHVPYRGGSEPVQAVVAGQVMVNFMDASTAKPLIEAGRIKGLGVTTLTQSPVLPGIPPMAESGLPGFESSTDFALLAPAGTPQPILDTLLVATRKVLATPAVREQLTGRGIAPIGGTPAEFTAYSARENAKWREVIRSRGIRAA